MNVDLTPDIEELVQSKVRSGRYDSMGEVLREAVRLLDQRDQFFTARNEEYRSRSKKAGWPQDKMNSSMGMTYSTGSTRTRGRGTGS